MLQMIGANISFWNEGLITEEVVSYVLSAMPAFIIGLTGGMVAYHFLQNTKTKKHSGKLSRN